MSSSRTVALAVALIAATCVLGIFDHDLWPPHEFRVGAIAMEMHRSGDFVVPTLGGKVFLEKPPLYTATAAALLGVFGGEPARTMRGASLIFGLLTILATARIAFVLGGPRRSFAAAAALATTLGLLQTGHYLVTDSALVAFVALSFLAFVEAREGRRAYRYLFWVFLALAFLSKGLVGLALILPAMFVFLAWERDLERILRLAPLVGPAIFAAVAAIWLVPLHARQDGELFHYWLIEQNFGRFLPSELVESGHHDEPLWFYLHGLPLVVMPWTIWLLGGIVTRVREGAQGARRLEKLALCWLVVGFVILSLSRSKRELYAIPIVPGATLLLSAWLGTREKVWGGRVWTWVLVGAVIAVVPAMMVLPMTGYVAEGPPAPSVVGACVVAVAAFLVVRHLRRRPGGLGMPAFWLAPSLLFIQVVVIAFPVMDQDASHWPGMREFERLTEGETVSSFRIGETFVGSFSFHLGWVPRDMTKREEFRAYLAESPDELLIVRRRRWPFRQKLTDDLPELVTQLNIVGHEWIVILKPSPRLELDPDPWEH